MPSDAEPSASSMTPSSSSGGSAGSRLSRSTSSGRSYTSPAMARPPVPAGCRAG
ncbi:MAG TPA: hypothetical protein VN969_30565 [Streptosporangiaceae bacterium]|nr:hypothetical protein [Streptosporangiaceae bacterium]